MDVFISILLQYGFFIALFIIGWVFGRYNEHEHLRQLNSTEKELGYIIVSSERFYRPTIAPTSESILVMGSVVVAQDYFKMIIAGICNFFGLNLTTYESLFERARREAMVRMRREAQFEGYNQIFGVRFEVTTINATGSMVEAIAYGTGVYTVDNPKIPPALPRVE